MRVFVYVCFVHACVCLCLYDVRGKHTCLGTILELSIEQLKSEVSLLPLCVHYRDSTQVIMSVSLGSKVFFSSKSSASI